MDEQATPKRRIGPPPTWRLRVFGLLWLLVGIALFGGLVWLMWRMYRISTPPTPERDGLTSVESLVNVDNGTSGDLQVFVDGYDYGALKPGQVLAFEVPVGKHQLIVRQEGREIERHEVELRHEKLTLINPLGLNRYQLMTATYGGGLFGPGPTRSTLGNARLIQCAADYDLTSSLPSTIKVPKGQGRTQRTKVVRFEAEPEKSR